MSTSARVVAAFGLVGLLSTALACQDTSTTQRCNDLSTYLESRDRELTRTCAGDEDCQVVWLRPDAPTAATVVPDDPHLRRAVHEYSTQCASRLYGDDVDSLPVATGNLSAVCESQIADERLPDGGTVEVVTSRLCILRGTVEVPDPIDAGATDVTPADVCECTDDAACGAGARCIGCQCAPAGICADACVRAAECDALGDLNLGSTPATCTLLCEDAALTDAAGIAAFADCLQSAECGELTRCRP